MSTKTCKYRGDSVPCSRPVARSGNFCGIHGYMIVHGTACREYRAKRSTDRWLKSWAERAKKGG